MKFRFAIPFLLFLAGGIVPLMAAGQSPAPGESTNLLEIQYASVDGKILHWPPGGELDLGAFPPNVYFRFGPGPQAPRTPLRLFCRLDGYDRDWRESSDFMFVMIRFYNEAGDRVANTMYKVTRKSTGWDGTLEGSQLTHRRETLTVPPGASRLLVVISSASSPSCVGVYVVEDLTVSRLTANNHKPEVLLSSPFEDTTNEISANQDPNGWQRDGTRPSMAKIVEVGRDPKTRAFAIIDDDVGGHAEWHVEKNSSPRVKPMDDLIVEWNEMYSFGLGEKRSADYPGLAPGVYKFRVAEADVYGNLTGVEASVAIRVSPPYWSMPWFWAVLALIGFGVSGAGVRYLGRRKLQRKMRQLEQQHLLEQERVRIAQDIHDDLGARVTQISLLSGMARQNDAFSEKARAEFTQISLAAQDLVAALYETVWAVSPENDNLDAMGNYLCQRINELCTMAQLRCRLYVSPLPREIMVSSLVRHNISMAAKEAIHNIIKHARATEVVANITLEERRLTVSIQDNGCGFKTMDAPAGNGLVNMKRRLEVVEGSCQVESTPGRGTTVYLRLTIKSPGENPPAMATAQTRDSNRNN